MRFIMFDETGYYEKKIILRYKYFDLFIFYYFYFSVKGYVYYY